MTICSWLFRIFGGNRKIKWYMQRRYPYIHICMLCILKSQFLHFYFVCNKVIEKLYFVLCMLHKYMQRYRNNLKKKCKKTNEDVCRRSSIYRFTNNIIHNFWCRSFCVPNLQGWLGKSNSITILLIIKMTLKGTQLCMMYVWTYVHIGMQIKMKKKFLLTLNIKRFW